MRTPSSLLGSLRQLYGGNAQPVEAGQGTPSSQFGIKRMAVEILIAEGADVSSMYYESLTSPHNSVWG